MVKHSCVDVEEFRLLQRVKDELSESASGNLILRGTRLVIPKSLREHVINLAHEGEDEVTIARESLVSKHQQAGRRQGQVV